MFWATTGNYRAGFEQALLLHICETRAVTSSHRLSSGKQNFLSYALRPSSSSSVFARLGWFLWWTKNLNPGTVNCPVVVNTDALNDLSDAHRSALMDSVDEALDHYVTNYNSNTMEKWDATLADKNIQVIEYGDAEIAAFKEKVATPTAKKWIEDNSGSLPAQELYDLVVGMLK